MRNKLGFYKKIYELDPHILYLSYFPHDLGPNKYSSYVNPMSFELVRLWIGHGKNTEIKQQQKK